MAFSLRLAIATSDLARRFGERLRGTTTTAPNVVWQEDGHRLLIRTESVAVRSVDGWLLVNLDVQTDQTGRATLQFVFFLGRAAEGSGPQAAGVVNAPNALAAQVADRWGAELQRVLWDGVLDGVEASIARAAALKPGKSLLLAGFHCDATSLHVDVFERAP